MAIDRQGLQRRRGMADGVGAQGLLGLVHLLRHVPVLDDARAADRRQADGLVTLDAGPPGHVRQDEGREEVKTVRAREDALPLADRFGLLVAFPVRARSPTR